MNSMVNKNNCFRLIRYTNLQQILEAIKCIYVNCKSNNECCESVFCRIVFRLNRE